MPKQRSKKIQKREIHELEPKHRSLIRGHHTILFVDDDDFLTDLAVNMLKHSGYKIRTASNGTEALDLCRAMPQSKTW